MPLVNIPCYKVVRLIGHIKRLGVSFLLGMGFRPFPRSSRVKMPIPFVSPFKKAPSTSFLSWPCRAFLKRALFVIVHWAVEAVVIKGCRPCLQLLYRVKIMI